MSERLSGQRRTVLVVLLVCINLAIFAALGRVLVLVLSSDYERPISAASIDAQVPPTVLPAFPATWTVTPTSTVWPTRPATSTPAATPVQTQPVQATRTPVLPLLTLPPALSAAEEQNRQARIQIIESAASAVHDKVPVVILLGIAALESQGSFSNQVADHGVMGVTPKAGRCYTLVYQDTAFDLRQNVSDAACHLNGYAWDRASGTESRTMRIKNAIRSAGFSDYMAQVVAAVHWYAGETQPEYLAVLADIIDGNVDQARSVPANFGHRYRNPGLAQSLRIAYHALIAPD